MPPPRTFRDAFMRALAPVSPRVVVSEETRSTMDDARALARDGAPHLTVVVTNHQTAGRGRLGRAWYSAPGLALQASWVLRPALPVDRWTVVPLLVGVAAAAAVRARAKVEATLKWPNDVQVGGRKLGGILVEAEPPAFLVVGLGLNVSHPSFPAGVAATSLALEGAVRLDRADLLAAILTELERALAEPDAALARYREVSATIGRRVRAERAGSEHLEGTALGIDERGALLLDTGVVTAGEVVHLRDAVTP